MGFGRIKDPTGEAPLERRLHADQLGEEPGRGRLGGDAAARKDEAEARAGRGHADVHRQLHGHADADRSTIDGADHRLEAAKDAQGDQAAAVAIDIAHAGLFACRVGAIGVIEGFAAGRQVGTGTKGAPRTGHNHHPHCVVGVGRIEGRDHVVTHLRGEGVHFLGTVEGDRGDAVGHVVEQGFEGRGGHERGLRIIGGSSVAIVCKVDYRRFERGSPDRTCCRAVRVCHRHDIKMPCD